MIGWISQNILLREMLAGDLALLAPALVAVDMAKGEVFALPENRIGYSWFPVSGMVSVVATTPAGDQAEVGVVGREGMFAVSTLHGIDCGTMHVFAQLPGRALRLPANALHAAMAASPTLQAHLLAYAHRFTMQIAAAALAYATRTIEERLARWLLMCLDRQDGPEIALTHESLALMLGSRRAGVTVAVQGLEARGAVTTRRGTIVVVDRGILENIAADVYGIAEHSYEQSAVLPAARNGAGPVPG